MRTVYKYLCAKNALDDLEHRHIRIGRMNELNDIVDCRPFFSCVEDHDPGAIQKRLNDRFGIICYCGTAGNQLVWSHYGDHHRGIALGFELPEQSDKTHPEWERLHAVYYDPDNERPIANLITYSSSGEPIYHTDEQILADGYTVKGFDWKYEGEHRQFVPLTETRPTASGYFLPMRGTLREVVLGQRCTVDPELIHSLVAFHRTPEDKGKRVEIFSAQIDEREFKVNLVPRQLSGITFYKPPKAKGV